MKELLIIAIGSAIVNNVVLSQFLGICPFLGVSKKVETASGMGGAVIFVITIASFITSLIYKFILVAASCTFNALGFNPFKFFNANENIIEGFFYTNYSPGGSDRMYLSAYNAGRVDYFRQTIEEWFV